MTTEQETPEQDWLPVELPVPFQGREIFVRMPRPEQLLVWQRTLNKLGNLQAGTSWTGDEVMVALERLRKIVDSLVVNKADVEWLDDRFLEGSLTFAELAPFITDAVAVYQKFANENAPNREARRAAEKPAKKAARKKATR